MAQPDAAPGVRAGGGSARTRGGIAAVLLAAFVGGAGTMTVELAAVRLLAPWFGTSLVVWTNVIAVVLLALSLGYAVGGRLSSGPHPLRRMGRALALAALFTAVLPFAAGLLAPLLVPRGLALDSAAEVVLWGSLAASLVLFLPPSAFLGAVAPLAVESVQEAAGGTAGRAGGVVLAASTLGSLLGVFGTSHLLLPRLGLRGTFLAAALALFLAALLAAWSARRIAREATLVLAAAALVGAGTLAPRVPLPRQDTRVLAHVESRYQSLRVVEDSSYDPPLRFLQVNEGLDSFQSVWSPEPGLLGPGFYYDDFALPLWWDRARTRWRVLVLGLGGGTAFRVLDGAAPEGDVLDLTGVELDPAAVRLGRKYMDLAPDDVHHHVLTGLDARVALRELPDGWDLVILDCYANQVEIPPHLATRELFALVHGSLAPGGWLVANVAGFGQDDPVVEAVSASAAAGFGAPVAVLPVPRARNLTVVARRDAPLPLDAHDVPLPVEGALEQRLAPLALPGAVRRVPPPAGRAPLTDDRAPLELLQLRSIREARALLERGGEER